MNIRELADQAGLKEAVLLRVYGTEDALCDSEIAVLRQIEKFAELVAEHEREECAKLCEKQIEKENLLKTDDEQTLSNLLIGHRVTAHMTAARLIRERNKA